MRRALVTVVVVACAALGVARVWGETPAAAKAPAMAMAMQTPMPKGVSPLEHGGRLDAGARHGLAHRLRQYPDLAHATAAQRERATTLWRGFVRSTAKWSSASAAARAGFDVRRPSRAAGDNRPMWFHSENRRWHADRRYLDLAHPDTLIYLDLPRRPLRLVGVMISMPRGGRGATPGGAITRWHYHRVCVDHGRRGLAPRADGSCPAGAMIGQGSEMMHVWFTRDLRSAYAIHAPTPELCAARLLPTALCDGRVVAGM